MRGTDKKRSFADAIAPFAPDSRAIAWEVLDVSAVLEVPGVPKERDPGDFVLQGRGEPAHALVHDSSALRVATRNDDFTALGFVERRYAFVDGAGIRASGAYVGRYRRRVEDGESLHSR